MYQNDKIKKLLLWKLNFIHILDNESIQNDVCSNG